MEKKEVKWSKLFALGLGWSSWTLSYWYDWNSYES